MAGVPQFWLIITKPNCSTFCPREFHVIRFGGYVMHLNPIFSSCLCWISCSWAGSTLQTCCLGNKSNNRIEKNSGPANSIIDVWRTGPWCLVVLMHVTFSVVIRVNHDFFHDHFLVGHGFFTPLMNSGWAIKQTVIDVVRSDSVAVMCKKKGQFLSAHNRVTTPA